MRVVSLDKETRLCMYMSLVTCRTSHIVLPVLVRSGEILLEAVIGSYSCLAATINCYYAALHAVRSNALHSTVLYMQSLANQQHRLPSKQLHTTFFATSIY
jgi:hypothetical protein